MVAVLSILYAWASVSIFVNYNVEARRLEAPGRKRYAVSTLRGGGAAQTAKAAKHDDHRMSGIELGACVLADLCPHGMLPLAWASVAGGGTGAVPCVVLIAFFCALSSYTMYLSVLVTETNKVPRTEEVIEQFQNGGESDYVYSVKVEPPKEAAIVVEKRGAQSLSSAWRSAGLPYGSCIDILVSALCGGCCIFYAAFATDLFHSLARQFISASVSRLVILLSLMAAPLIPLCLSNDLSALKYSSYAGLIGILYTVLYVSLFGPPENTLAQQKLRSVTSANSPPIVGFFDISSGTAVLVNTIVVSFICHYNAIQYYLELREPRNTKKYAKITSISLAATATIFIAILFAGRNAFGFAALPNLLNNLPDDSILAALARFGTGIAILSGFPLMFAGFKAALDAALPSLLPQDIRQEIKNLEPSSNFSAILETVPLRSILHLTSLFLIGLAAALATEEDIGLVIELIGSTIGCAAAYIVPALSALASPSLSSIHRRAALLIALAGSLLSICSTYITLQHA